MASKDLDTLMGVILGALGAVVVAKILSQKRCRNCNHLNASTNTFCDFCGGNLR
jgi:rRNA maturation endonuclease Nob1